MKSSSMSIRLFPIYLTCLFSIFSCEDDSNDPEQFKFTNPILLSNNINSDFRDAGPEVSNDDLSLYFHSDRAGGLGNLDIWISTRESSNTPWKQATNLSSNINTDADDRAPSISSDGLVLFFASNRIGGAGSYDLYVSTRPSVNDIWGMAISIGVNINTQFIESGPSISTDGLTLFFHSDRPGSLGDTDLYMATRLSITDPWETPVNLGSTINTTSFEVAPEISSNNLSLYFHSARGDTPGDLNLWVATRASKNDNWGIPMVLSPPANSASIDTGPSISSDGKTLYFGSDRKGSDVRDIWQVSR